jgi:peptide-methionine (S)-S-oxide reductase
VSKIKEMPEKSKLLPGRDQAIELDYQHAVLNVDMRNVPDQCEVVWLGLGCFWGAERLFWQLPGVVATAVGYAGGETRHPSYDEVCSGYTGHTEIVQVTYNPAIVTLTEVLKVFWEAHDPTQGMRQGNDIGTQYRSAIYGTEKQIRVAEDSRVAFQQRLNEKGLGTITTEIKTASTFYYAEGYHQQYLHKNPQGYCGLKGTGVVCPI